MANLSARATPKLSFSKLVIATLLFLTALVGNYYIVHNLIIPYQQQQKQHLSSVVFAKSVNSFKQQLQSLQRIIDNFARDSLVKAAAIEQQPQILAAAKLKGRELIPEALAINFYNAVPLAAAEPIASYVGFGAYLMLQQAFNGVDVSPEIHQLQGEKVINFVATIKDIDNKPQAAVVVTLPFVWMEQQLESFEQPQGEVVLLQQVDANNNLLVMKSAVTAKLTSDMHFKTKITENWALGVAPYAASLTGKANNYIYNISYAAYGVSVLAFLLWLALFIKSRKVVKLAVKDRTVVTENLENIEEDSHQQSINLNKGAVNPVFLADSIIAAEEQQQIDDVSAEIFRAYDIRGTVDENLDEKIAKLIGKAIGTMALAQKAKSIIVGRDGRNSSPDLQQSLIEGLLTTGINVTDIGLVATPVLYFAISHLKVGCGIMVTGSHNPKDDNGFKIVINNVALTDTEIKNLYQIIVENKFAQGSGALNKDIINDIYVAELLSKIKLEKRLKVVVDCGNGAAAEVATDLFSKLNCDSVMLFNTVDGNFPNHHPDPSVIDNLHQLITEVGLNQADIGIAFDGDGDRIGVVSKNGDIIWPDMLLILFATELLSRKNAAEVIYDVKCSSHVAPCIEELGGKATMCATGHSVIRDKMQQSSALLAGEMSGHLFFADEWFGFDDALYAAARLLQLLAKDEREVDEIFAALPDSCSTPEIYVPISEQQKFEVVKKLQQQHAFENANIITIDGIRAEFADGWGLVRASNTTACLVLRFEAKNDIALDRIQQTFKQQLLAVEPSLQLDAF